MEIGVSEGGVFFPRCRQFYTCNGWIGIYSICPSDISLKKEGSGREELEYDQKFVRVKILGREGELIQVISYRLVLSVREIL